MLATVSSSAVYGIDAYGVEVEVNLSGGIPGFKIGGLPDASCRESSDRVRSAIRNSGYPFPSGKIMVNLAPADLKKEGSAFDMAIAVGILAAQGVIELPSLENRVFVGELSLDGRLRRVRGMLPRVAMLLDRSEKQELLIPAGNAEEASCLRKVAIRPAFALREVVDYLHNRRDLKWDPLASGGPAKRMTAHGLDFADIRGQAHAKRALEIAAAGGHNVLMIGPPGSGKTMLARRIPSILSEIAFEEAVETTKIHSVAGLLTQHSGLVEDRPFRDPHHTISHAAMIGGGTHPRPGEVSLAHNGVLFLDELPEFRKDVLEVLRQPLEEGRVTISRASGTITLPARFMMIGAMNPCPCGYFTDPKKECHCSSLQVQNYLSKVSGPLLDRMDIQIEVPALPVGEMATGRQGEASVWIRERVEAARRRQKDRHGGEGLSFNAAMNVQQIEAHCRLTPEADALLKMAIQDLGFSMRAFHKALKVARTIADLDGGDVIEAPHVSEAIHYRTLDRNVWFR